MKGVIDRLKPLEEIEKELSWPIEPPIRKFVKELREAGFNTHMSCGHNMWVMIEMQALAEIANLLEYMLQSSHKDNFHVSYRVTNGVHDFSVFIRLNIANYKEPD